MVAGFQHLDNLRSRAPARTSESGDSTQNAQNVEIGLTVAMPELCGDPAEPPACTPDRLL
jgi:hypothetical protein